MFEVFFRTFVTEQNRKLFLSGKSGKLSQLQKDSK